MKYIKQELRPCLKCDTVTLQYKNSSKINWLLHIFLLIISAGLWVIPFIIILILGMNVWDSEKFVCSKCGA